jgi:hypothetical protein
MLKEFARMLVFEAKDGPRPQEIDIYVDRYGKDKPGFLNYAEFTDIYKTFVVPNTKSK